MLRQKWRALIQTQSKSRQGAQHIKLSFYFGFMIGLVTIPIRCGLCFAPDRWSCIKARLQRATNQARDKEFTHKPITNWSTQPIRRPYHSQTVIPTVNIFVNAVLNCITICCFFSNDLEKDYKEPALASTNETFLIS